MHQLDNSSRIIISMSSFVSQFFKLHIFTMCTLFSLLYLMKPDTISDTSVSPTVLLLKVWWEGQLHLYHLGAYWNYTGTPSQLDLQNQKLQFNKFPRRFVCISQFEKHCPITPKNMHKAETQQIF